MADSVGPTAIDSTRQAEHTLAPVCFRTPVSAIERSGYTAIADATLIIGKDPKAVLSGLRSADGEALATLVPSLMCGEESAVHVFFRAGRRKDNATSVGRELLWQISAEEAVHEAMLSHLRSELPIVHAFEEIRERAREFFLRMSSNDTATQFLQIAALDSGVCKIMAALCGPNSHINHCESVHRIACKIRYDEARHVRFSRQYLLDLGKATATFRDFNHRVSIELVALLFPIGGAFETLGVDSDRLFRRIISEDN